MAEDQAVREAVEQLGLGSLPLVIVDGVVVHAGSYPSREALAAYLTTAWTALHLGSGGMTCRR
jgi:hypothetical protein